MPLPSISRSLSGRAIHLTVTPRPTNIRESREVLHLLSQFGEIEYFKNLKYDALPTPNTAIAIFEDFSAAASCLRRSPIRFRMDRAVKDGDSSGFAKEDGVTHPEQPQDKIKSHDGPDELSHFSTGLSGSPFGLGQRRSMTTTTSPRAPGEPFNAPSFPSSESLPEARVFQIQTRPAQRNFRDHINTGHYYTGFSINSKSIVQKALAKSVPMRGLSCVNWKTEPKPWRLVSRDIKSGHNKLGKRKTLRELYEESPSGLASSKDRSLP